MDNKEKSPFTIGSRPDTRQKLEELKNALEDRESAEKKIVPASSSEKSAGASGQYPDKYPKIATGETEDELKARLSKEHLEMQEQRKNVSNEAVRNLGKDPELISVFEQSMAKGKPRVASIEKSNDNLAEKFTKEIQEAAGLFQESASQKKKILEDLKQETDTERKKQLWHKKNYITLEHQRNWAAFAYMNAVNEAQKNKAKEDFTYAKKTLEEYVYDPDEYEKKNKWEYQALPAASVAAEKMATKTQEIKKETPAAAESAEIKSSEEGMEEPKPPSSVAEELENSFGKKPEKTVETKTEEVAAKEPGKEKEQEEAPPVVDGQVEYAEKEGGDKYIKKLEETRPEEVERIKELKKSLENQEKQIEKEAEKKGYLDTIRTIGEHYKKARLTYKGALALAVLAGVSFGGVAALLGASIGVAARFGGGAAVFVGAEAFLEKKRQEKERWWNKNPKIMAAVSASIMAGPVMSKVISITNADEWLSHMWDKVFGGGEAAQSALEQAHDKIIPPSTVSSMTPEVKAALEHAHEAIVPPEVSSFNAEKVAEAASATATEATHTVVSGENLHNIIGSMKELSELDGGRKENAIANLIAHIQKNPAEYGVVSGDVNRLAVGDYINMEKIHAALGETKIGGESIIEHAKHLTSEQVASVEAPELSGEEFTSSLDKTVSELGEAHSKVSALMEGLDNIGQSPALDLSDAGIANMGATEELPSAAQRHLESIFGVGERELGDADWKVLQGEQRLLERNKKI
ncbi:MAG: hypothetical protein HZC03_00485 [Candidatus Lloydbacteria bacterium]|nr:hypothetical protein [Candidatus Lloydbacteria bacterium]